MSIRRLTDLCEYCEKGNHLKKKIIKFANEQNYNLLNNNDNLTTMTNYFSTRATNILADINENNNENIGVQNDLLTNEYNSYKTIISDIEDYQSILFHKNIANTQRKTYSNQTKNIEYLENKLIELDFKQKIVIGMSPRQVSREYYNQTMRSCLLSKIKAFKF